MIKTTFTLLFLFSFVIAHAKEEQFTTVTLKYITGEEATSVLKSLTDKPLSISERNNMLIIKGAANKTKNIVKIINEIDTPASPLTIEFISSKRKINFKKSSNIYESGKNINNTSQSMSITERQWVILNTGISVPMTERTRHADGTETQSSSYKKISKNYLFKVHEFSGQSVIQVGLNSSALSQNIAGAIEHTKLDTTIVGKTGDWLEVASSNQISDDENSNIYSTNQTDKTYLHLYVRVKKNNLKKQK